MLIKVRTDYEKFNGNWREVVMNSPDNTFRLTSLQQELWMSHENLHQKHPGISCGGKFLLNGCPDLELMHKALLLFLKSNSLLTATLRQDNHGMPFMETGVYPEPDFRIYDLRNNSNDQIRFDEIVHDFIEQKFEPVGGRLCRF
ncbi:MAG TPA: hypothetical protein VHO68_00520, partial [Bacteroidales bacterium]|nr:hypothetical protein [Bacteroidales bacterium]